MKRQMIGAGNGFKGESLRTERVKDIPTEKSQRNRRRQGEPPKEIRWGVLVFTKEGEEWSRETVYFSTKRDAQMYERELVEEETDFYWLSSPVSSGWREDRYSKGGTGEGDE